MGLWQVDRISTKYIQIPTISTKQAVKWYVISYWDRRHDIHLLTHNISGRVGKHLDWNYTQQKNKEHQSCRCDILFKQIFFGLCKHHIRTVTVSYDQQPWRLCHRRRGRIRKPGWLMMLVEDLTSSKLTVWPWKWPVYSGFTSLPTPIWQGLCYWRVTHNNVEQLKLIFHMGSFCISGQTVSYCGF